MDMEVWESFIMHRSFKLLDVHANANANANRKEIAYANEHSFEEVNVCNVITIDICIKNFMVIPANATAEEMIADGYKIITVVPGI